MKFTPHLFLKVQNDHPRPIFVLATTNIHTLLRIEMPRVVSVKRLQKTIRQSFAARKVPDVNNISPSATITLPHLFEHG